VIFSTSKDDEMNDILGLKMGAEDVVRKPFSRRVLTQRVKTVLKRVTEKSGASQKEDHIVIECGQLRIDTARYVCTWKSKPVPLTRTELLMMQALVGRPGVVRSRDALMDAVHGDPVHIDDRAIDVHIKRMRKKLKAVNDSFDMIDTLYGIGYRFKEH
jgi:two-component system, OmpR family, response regulator ChvI